MRTIPAADIAEAVRELAVSAACDLEPDILDALLAARDRETSELARDILEMLIVNADIASREQIPACQDTGIAVVFVALGRDVRIDGDLLEAVQEGVRRGYQDGYLRMSICDVLTGANTGTNTPAVVHVELEPGSNCRIRFLPKGCGSENVSSLKMLPPSAGMSGAVEHIVETAVRGGADPCPPLVVGAGIGGTFEQAALMAKKSLMRPVGEASGVREVSLLEKEALERINREGAGVLGMGGCNTALAVHIDTCPTHIGSLPVAVNIQCHSHRHKEVIL
jgi:fumarate hydratase subunit alpha